MAKKTKTYPLYIALLLCFFQVAGIDVYAQEPVKVSQDSISPVREAPKARARRHREPVVSTPATDSVKVEKAVVLPPIDSLENLKPAIVTADSLEEVNRQNLERIETPVMPSVVKADSLPPVMPKKLFVPNPTKATWYAIVFPGGGQIYNRKYWKLPIIYGGFAGCAYALSWNGKMYKDWWPLWYYLGVASMELGKVEEAAGYFKTVLKLSPSNQETMKELVKAYELLGDEEMARKYRKKITVVAENAEKDRIEALERENSSGGKIS